MQFKVNSFFRTGKNPPPSSQNHPCFLIFGSDTMNLKKNGDRRKDTKNAVKRGIQKDFVLMKVTEISKF